MGGVSVAGVLTTVLSAIYSSYYSSSRARVLQSSTVQYELGVWESESGPLSVNRLPPCKLASTSYYLYLLSSRAGEGLPVQIKLASYWLAS